MDTDFITRSTINVLYCTCCTPEIYLLSSFFINKIYLDFRFYCNFYGFYFSFWGFNGEIWLSNQEIRLLSVSQNSPFLFRSSHWIKRNTVLAIFKRRKNLFRCTKSLIIRTKGCLRSQKQEALYISLWLCFDYKFKKQMKGTHERSMCIYSWRNFDYYKLD